MTELDPVVAYDVMREASARLMGLYAGQITTGGPADPAIAEMRKIRAEARAIDTHDAAAQAAATADFRAIYMRPKNDGTDEAESADRARKVRDAVGVCPAKRCGSPRRISRASGSVRARENHGRRTVETYLVVGESAKIRAQLSLSSQAKTHEKDPENRRGSAG